MAIACVLLAAAAPATAVERIELSVGRIDAPGLQLRELRADWQAGAGAGVQTRVVLPAPLAAPATIRLRCARLELGDEASCTHGEARLDAGAALQLRASGEVRWQSPDRWRLQLAALQATLGYSSADGRIASEALRLDASGSALQDHAGRRARIELRASSGQAYVEPLFLDLGQHPLHLSASLRQAPGGARVTLAPLSLTLGGIGSATLAGELDPAAPAQHHRLDVHAELTSLATAAELFARPWLAGTRIDDLRAGGTATLAATIVDAQPQRAELQLRDAGFGSDKLGGRVDGVAADLHWRADGTPPPSQLAWTSGAIGALPLGAARAALQLRPRGLALLDTLQIPILDGGLRVFTLGLDGLGGSALSADFDATLDPIDLAALCRAFGWPEFGGQIGGRLPGLRLRDRELRFDGQLRAQAFDGELTVDALRVLDPLGVLPRVSADLAIRRLDLAQLTGAFSFGRIEGRLDGDVRGLRLLGWQPVAMDAHLYTTPGDRSRHRISQRAIDNISSIGGGPSGVLSRGALRFFEDFAYDRIGWRCRLDDGVCRMDGIGPAKDGRGYVLVKGRLLPRIDVVGYNRDVAWATFLAQLKSVAQANAAQVQVQ